MARLTAQDMLDIVRDSLGGETSETISDTRILRFINQSYLELSSQYHFDQLNTSTTITTSSGTTDYELSVDSVQQIHDLVDETNKFVLDPMNEHQYNKFTSGGTQSGNAVYWLIHGVGPNNRWQLRLWPTPNSTATIRVHYQKKPTELVLSPAATSTVIPEEWDDSIIYRAVSRGWMMLGDPDVAAKWRQASMANDRAAYKSTYHPSKIRERVRSKVGGALLDV